MAIADTVRRYVEAGREALSPKKAEDMAKALAKQGEIRRDQVATLARDLVAWSRRNRDRLVEVIGAEVKKQIARAGVATRDEVDSLKRRVRELERGARTSGSRSTSTTRKPRTASGKARTASGKKATGRKKPTSARRPPT